MKTKYVIVIPDGAADTPQEIFDCKTVIEAAQTPNIDWIAQNGKQGLAQTVPAGYTPGSDVAMMSLLGYDPDDFYSGRAPIEAAAMSIPMAAEDWIFRCNLVTFSDNNMADHSAGHIPSKEAKILIEAFADALANENIRFFPGVSYRNLARFSNYTFDVKTQPPHDIIGQPIEKNLPKGKNADILIDIMARSQQFFAEHEINRIRKDLGENPVSSIWLWGQGQQAFMDKFSKKYGLNGAAITAVDLVRGLSKLIGFDLIEVEGATGYIDTNFSGKATAAIEALDKYDIVLVHVEAPDEAGHAGSAEIKKQAIEKIDKLVIAPIIGHLKTLPSWRILVMPDHPTPVNTQAHSGDPVPFAMAGKNVEGILKEPFSEKNAEKSSLYIEKGCELMEYFLKI